MLLIELREKLIQMIEQQKGIVEDSIEFVMLQIKIIAHNLLFRIYSNEVIMDMLGCPEPKEAIDEVINKVCFTTQSNMIQIFMSDYKLAHTLALNFEEILKESETKDKNYEVKVSTEVEGAVIDILLNKSRIETFKDYNKNVEVYSI